MNESRDTSIFQLSGSLPGPTVMILGGIHGDELCGIKVIEQLRSELFLRRGRLILAYGNPQAIIKNQRQTETNLNRMFLADNEYSPAQKSTYEYQRARELICWLDQAEALLDLHSSPTPASPPFLIAGKNAWSIVQQLPFEICCTNFDQAEPGGTDYYMNQHHKIGICAECGYHFSPTSFTRAYDCALAFLRYFNLLESPRTLSLAPITIYQAKYAYLTKTNQFYLKKPLADFTLVRKHQLLAWDGGVAVYADFSGVILFARDRNQTGVEGFILLE